MGGGRLGSTFPFFAAAAAGAASFPFLLLGGRLPTLLRSGIVAIE